MVDDAPFGSMRSRAHAFILQSRLVISLAWVAGFVNVVAVVACGHVVSHMTGHASALGMGAAEGSWRVALTLAALIAAFFLGALCSGLAVEFGRQRGWASIYVLPASIELALLCGFAGLEATGAGHAAASGDMRTAQWWMTVIASVAMGLQNATITRISSGVVRTTHLTGIVTDLGHESAQLLVTRTLAGRAVFTGTASSGGPSLQRILLLASIFGSFVLGSACGALSEACLGNFGMLPPVLFLAWIVVADLRTPICEMEPAILAARAGAPTDFAVFRAIPRGASDIETHLPDLAAWIRGLPVQTRAAVLDLGAVRVFGPLAATSLEGMLAAAERRGMRVVVAGIDGAELATVNALSRANLLHEGNCAATVEDAVASIDARGLGQPSPGDVGPKE